jgi:hypothetical protein
MQFAKGCRFRSGTAADDVTQRSVLRHHPICSPSNISIRGNNS